MVKKFLKKITPHKIISIYHEMLAWVFALWYFFPSKSFIVIGVTGTNGKSTTVNLIAKIIEGSGEKVGLTSTINFKIDKEEWINKSKMTMLGRGALQKMLYQMKQRGCTYAIIETSSEGIAQKRHKGIHYDVVVFTNLTPEHIESHGSFEKYKNAKLELFSYFETLSQKTINKKAVPKGIVINGNDDHANDFIKTTTAKKLIYGVEKKKQTTEHIDVLAKEIIISEKKSSFVLSGTRFETKLTGMFNMYNLLAAITTVQLLGLNRDRVREAVEKIKPFPGRMEFIEEGQPFTVIVDFAYEPAGVAAVYETIAKFKYNHLVHLLGSAGGGRDKARRKILGRLAGKTADYVVVTNEDPYDEDPHQIIEEVGIGAKEEGKIENKTLFLIDDREAGIRKALSLAKENDLVLITGKGSEQVMAVKRGTIPWDDRKIVRKALNDSVDKV